jgi:hypothetical protein
MARSPCNCLIKNLLGHGNYLESNVSLDRTFGQISELTLVACAIRFDVSRGNLAVNDLKGISLASNASEDGSTIESEVKGFGEFTRGISKEANLRYSD